jgi:2-keto-4-pentenoate hydratase/2-oxohepta-3-ene-1,7-dioic acid hydratase in catechol pathway
MAQWLRFQHQGKTGLGQVQGDQIAVYSGDLFSNPQTTGEILKLSDVTIDIPCTPSKMVAMVDNFHALVTKLEHAVPTEPLYFLKGNNSFLAANQVIRTPKSYSGKVVYEGELGIVIGKACHEVDEAQAARAIFGYTCINDVTAIEILNRDPGYAQWTRSKSFNTFGVFGPYITTDVDPSKLSIKTILSVRTTQSLT